MTYEFKIKDFHGLSTPEELKNMWKELRLYEDDNDINVIWDYTKPQQLKPGFNIVNILYDPEHPDETGHYCLITVNNNKRPKEVEFFNPVASHTGDNKDKLKDILKYFSKRNYDVNVNLLGTQTETSENCGYHCLTHAYNYYNKQENKMWPKAKVETVYTTDIDNLKEFSSDDEAINDLVNEYGKRKRKGGADSGDPQEDILKTVRGIYYGLKYGFDRTTPARKKKKAEASGYMPRHYFKNLKTKTSNEGSGLANYYPKEVSYNRLRNIVEK